MRPPKSPRAKVIGDKILKFRERAGYTQEQLAEMVGVDTKTISNIEGGRTSIRLDLIEQIGAVLGFAVPDLYSAEKAS